MKGIIVNRVDRERLNPSNRLIIYPAFMKGRTKQVLKCAIMEQFLYSVDSQLPIHFSGNFFKSLFLFCVKTIVLRVTYRF